MTAPGAGTGEIPAATGAQVAPQPGAQVAPTTLLGPDGKPFEPERALNTIKQFREKESQWEKDSKELKALRERVEALDAASMSEQEKLTKKVQEYEAMSQQWQRERRELLTKPLLEKAADKAQMAEPSAIWGLVAHDTIEYDERGEPTEKSLEKAITAAKEKYPKLFATETAQPAAMQNVANTILRPAPANAARQNGQGVQVDRTNAWGAVQFKD